MLRRFRVLASVVAVFATVAVIASYVRVGLVALAVGLVVAGGMVITQSRWSRRQRIALLAAVVLVFAAGAVGTAIASSASADLRSRARVFLHPLADQSMRMRFTTWEAATDEIAKHPFFGTGLGSAGRNSERNGRHVVVDNSYLLILREQGLLVGLMFIAGIGVLLVAVGRELLRRTRRAHPLQLATFPGAFAFLVLCVAGEFLEQPGKVIAWLFLGLAAFGTARQFDVAEAPAASGADSIAATRSTTLAAAQPTGATTASRE
jgi:O-antigen ligase